METFFILLVVGVIVWAVASRTGGAPDPSRLRDADTRDRKIAAARDPEAFDRQLAASQAAPAPTVRVAARADRPAPFRNATRDAVRASPHPAGARWIPPGESVEAAGHLLPGGMLYVGERLPAVVEWRGMEPALIRPSLAVARDLRRIEAAETGYWPSYSEISRAFRGKYLRWLAQGRTGEVDVAAVFLFFYGIERRLLVDAERGEVPPEEADALLAEVERLRDLYGGNGSFHRYATGLLEFAGVRRGRIDASADAPPPQGAAGARPFAVHLAIGQLAASGRPVPAEWGLAWLRCCGEWYPRTAVQRCPDEFEIAFRSLYRQRFGEGLVLKPNRKRLTLEYRPASGSFSGQTHRLALDHLPDVSATRAPVERLKEVAEAATEAIDRYSRFVGRSGDGNSVAALGLLPPEVLRRRVRRDPPALVGDVASALRPEGRGTVGTRTLIGHWPSANAEKLTRKEAEGLAEFLEKLGIGIAPDARHTGINLSQSPTASVFLLPPHAPAPGPDFANATLLLTLAAAVAGSDQIAQQEEEEIERHLESAYALNDADRQRLRGHLDWLRACPPSTAGLRKQLEVLPPETRREIARALIGIAGADGHVSAAEVRMLSKLYPLLGFDAQQVYTDVHALAAAPPATILPADPPRDYAIPRPADEPAPVAEGFTLDTSRIAAIQHETHEVTRVLAAVFADGEEEPPGVAPQAASEGARVVADGEVAAPAGGDGTLLGLDAAHSALVRALAGRDEIDAAEFAALADARGLLPGGAVEAINEAAFLCCEEPLLEGTDPIEINPYAREELFR